MFKVFLIAEFNLNLLEPGFQRQILLFESRTVRVPGLLSLVEKALTYTEVERHRPTSLTIFDQLRCLKFEFIIVLATNRDCVL